MAIPNRGDPRRPLAQAVQSGFGAGVFAIVLGALAAVAGVWAARLTPGTLGERLLSVASGAVAFAVAPGVCYLVCAWKLSRYRAWAAVALLPTGGTHALLLPGAFAWCVAHAGDAPMPLVLSGFFLAVGVRLIVCLARSFTALRLYGADARLSAFEVRPAARLEAPVALPRTTAAEAREGRSW